MLTGRSAGGVCVMSCPSIRMRPDSGRSKPAMRLSSVDLPDPLGPMTAVKLPAGNRASKRIAMSS